MTKNNSKTIEAVTTIKEAQVHLTKTRTRYIPIDVDNCLFEVGAAVLKARRITGDITEEFPYDGENESWAYDYERLTLYIDIVFDYLAEASKKLNEIRELQNAFEGGASDD